MTLEETQNGDSFRLFPGISWNLLQRISTNYLCPCFLALLVALCRVLFVAQYSGVVCRGVPCGPFRALSPECRTAVYLYRIKVDRLAYCLFLSTCSYSTHYVRTVLLSWCWPTSYSLFINTSTRTCIVLCNLALVPAGIGAGLYLLPNY